MDEQKLAEILARAKQIQAEKTAHLSSKYKLTWEQTSFRGQARWLRRALNEIIGAEGEN